MTSAAPTLTDLPSRMKFEPGDRVIVRVPAEVSVEQVRGIDQIVKKWAGEDVRVLTVNPLTCILTRKRDGNEEILVGPPDTPGWKAPASKNAWNLSCSKIEIRPGDVIRMSIGKVVDEKTRLRLRDYLKEWAGDVEIIVDMGINP